MSYIYIYIYIYTNTNRLVGSITSAIILNPYYGMVILSAQVYIYT